jgi:ribonucleoside-diphosphate reductase alpha chain
VESWVLEAVGGQEISDVTWDEKYRYKDRDGAPIDQTRTDTHQRVAKAVYVDDADEHLEAAFGVMEGSLWIPGGRISAGLGTDKRVTALNCFANGEVDDSMDGIMDAVKVAALALQMGGGIGTGFSTLRPAGALVKRTASVSSGVLPFMGMWDAASNTIKSAGHRRGAMMATLGIDHPDVLEFIEAKREPGILTNFNLSVLVSDAFMEAKDRGGTWDLGFGVPRADGKHVEVVEKQGFGWYVYERLEAAELWERLMKAAYDVSEPGVMFVDRVNEMNPLWYLEHITVANPCGELPLPPFGACNLGHVCLPFLVSRPFTDEVEFDWDGLRKVVAVGQRFLDNVLDVALYPSEEFKKEALRKRRTGLGHTGLGSTLAMMGLRYGSPRAVKFASDVSRAICFQSYETSIELAAERGSFPAFKPKEHLEGKFVERLPAYLRDGIGKYGLRNGVLNTVAPVGTGSMAWGANCSSGIEPPFAFVADRKVIRSTGEVEVFEGVEDLGYRTWKARANGHDRPPYLVEAEELTVEDHLVMQAACQEWTDAAISKTINCPEGISFEDFRGVYDRAHELGLKGCTTYRPSPTRGAVIQKAGRERANGNGLPERARVLEGKTYKARWEPTQDSFYVTINDVVDADGSRKPLEIFVVTKSAQIQEWVSALTRTVSAVFRREAAYGGDVHFLVDELKRTFAATGGAFVDGRYVPSIPALVGGILEEHLNGSAPEVVEVSHGDFCPKCFQPALVRESGCSTCRSCDWSSCG